MNQLSFSFDVSRCSGCMACVVACQDQNDIISGEIAFRNVTRCEQGNGSDVSISFVSLSCMHCGDAPCLMACPTGAIHKNRHGGIIDVNRNLCIGCHSCELVCPFGAPKFAEDGKIAKCDFCITRMTNGMQPACVRVCPTRALTFGPNDEQISKKAQQAGLKILKSITGAI